MNFSLPNVEIDTVEREYAREGFADAGHTQREAGIANRHVSAQYASGERGRQSAGARIAARRRTRREWNELQQEEQGTQEQWLHEK